MEDDLFLVEATEPTNIIWENRHWTPADYFKRTIQVCLIILVLLTISFLAIYSCKKQAIDNARIYPNINEQKWFEDYYYNNPKYINENNERNMPEIMGVLYGFA